ncbi:PAS domain protein [Rhodobiaceae bacterium]|nr:PAS domain protein [Rhodobiaceae bacterium]
MANDDEAGVMPAWVAAYLDTRHVANIRARISGVRPDAPDEINGYKLSRPGRELLTWWLSVRQGDAPPTAEDVELPSLVELSPYLRYLSWEGEEALVIRLFGSALCEAIGLDPTGVDIFSLSQGDERSQDIARLKLIGDLPCGAVIFRHIQDQTGAAALVEMMTLPIEPGADGKKRIISTVIPVDVSSNRSTLWERRLNVKEYQDLHDVLYVDLGHGIPTSSPDGSVIGR